VYQLSFNERFERMSSEEQDRHRQIAELQAALQMPLPKAARQEILRSLQALLALDSDNQRSPTQPTAGSVAVSGTVRGATVGVNQGAIQLFFGTSPPPDAKALLDSYLEWLLVEYGRLRLGKLMGKEQSGQERAIMPAIALSKVYTSLATTTWAVGDSFTLPREDLLKQLDAGDPAQQLPYRVKAVALTYRERGATLDAGTLLARATGPLSEVWHAARNEVAAQSEGATLTGYWLRPETPLTAMMAHTRLVLLGSPGSGKSTVLRYLAIMLAEKLLEGGNQQRMIPMFCQLGQVARDLSSDPAHDFDQLVAALLKPVNAGRLRAGLDQSILLAWRKGSVLICLDGLDEVSSVVEQTRAGPRSRRERMADAIRMLARQVGKARLVVTCRTQPYEQDDAWQLRDAWIVRTLAPFAYGQVRHFVPAWYAQTCSDPQAAYHPAEGVRRAERLIEVIDRRANLGELTTSPLLLTMLALLDYNRTELPEKRVEVYEELVKLLLDRWEGVRSSKKDQRQQSIGERLGLKHLTTDDLRPVLHELAFVAHRQERDGRGVLSDELMLATLDTFFRRKLNPTTPKAVPHEAVARCSDAFILLLREETGLLQEEADGRYALPHLTFEEYLAACYLADQEDPALAYSQWQAAPDRWREVLLLLMGRLLVQRKLVMAFAWLQLLVAPHVGTTPKVALQIQREALFASACYAALGRREFLAERNDAMLGFERQLQARLTALLEQPDPTIRLPQRIEAGEALATLGDPRFPVSVTDWGHELERRNTQFGAPAGYFCAVPGGRYQIGGWPEEEDAEAGVVDKLKGVARRPANRSAAISIQPFWIARFPVTVAQYVSFVVECYGEQKQKWPVPLIWRQSGYTSPNQPIVTITWHEATIYCVWLTEQLAGVLPAGYVLRLPTEAEWEVAAAYDRNGQRSTYPWGDAPEPDQERAIYNPSKLRRPAPVGCCPAGAAACGALDMAGNVWELTANDYRTYPAGSHQPQKDFTDWHTAWRGGGWSNDSSTIRCGARVRQYFYSGGYDEGFRLVLAPPLA
jgi:formylglycine-generating enzyme required for sulfatase activity